MLLARRLAFAQAIFFSLTTLAAAQYEPPLDYYDTATGFGATLKAQLHDIIDAHEVFSYGDARSILQDTDQDPNDPDRMLLVYSRESLDVSAISPGGSPPGWDNGISWNREHTWPRSRGVDSSGPDNSDLHQLRPSDPGVNTSRGNKNFGGGFGDDFGAVSNTDYWYPGDADAGMIARQQFYMAVRYDGSDGSTEDLELANGDTDTSNRLGDLASLMDWHYRVAPDDFERRRNDVIYDDYQENRNPFIDHPEWAWSVFVDQANDSRIVLGGGVIAADGSSTRSVDLGRAYVGGASPSDATVSIEKIGLAGSYYAVSTTGAATTDFGDHPRPFAMGTVAEEVQLDTIEVGLGVSTASSGLFSGTVVVDNLDITTGGGADRGANDGDDVLDLSFAVLDHPVASFDNSELVTELTIDFGEVGLGEGLVVESFDLFNFAGAGSPSFAADLDLDGFSAIGDSSVAYLDSIAMFGLEQGGAFSLDAVLDTSLEGVFETTYTLDLSGEDLPGEQTQSVTLTLLAEVLTAGLAGDYNEDGVVDAADYTLYRSTFGSEDDLRADGDGSGTVDPADLLVWRDNYGASGGSAVAVPEPASLSLVVVLLGYSNAAARRRRNSSSP